jgi:poly(3-hydroxybutyrate) depolymerase
VQQRLPAGDYSETHWPIRQTNATGQTIARLFKVHVPTQHEQPQGQPLAIVVNLHGSGSTGATQDELSGMRQLGDAKGFIVVTPETWPWAIWTSFADDTRRRRGFSDVEFIRMLLDQVVDKLCVDRNRIFATGFSGGGVLSATLGRASAAGELGAHKIAAAAPVAAFPLPATWEGGAMAESLEERPFRAYVPGPIDALTCTFGPERREPVPMHVFFGNHERLVANGICYETYSREVSALSEAQRSFIRVRTCECYDPDPNGQRTCRSRPAVRGNVDYVNWFAQCMTNRWALENGCLTNMEPPVSQGSSGWGMPAGKVTFSCAAVPNSRGDTFFTTYDTTERPGHPNNIEQPHGHIWPGGALPYHASNFKVTDEIWAFFEKHPR